MCTMGYQQYENNLFNPAKLLQGEYSLDDLLVQAASFMSLLDTDKIGEIAKNFQVPNPVGNKKDNSNFQVKVDVKEYSPEDIDVKTVDNFIVVTAKHDEKKDDQGFISRQFVRKFPVPEDVKAETISCNMDTNGFLIISAPRIVKTNPQPERMIPIAVNKGKTTSGDNTPKEPVAGPSSATHWQ